MARQFVVESLPEAEKSEAAARPGQFVIESLPEQRTTAQDLGRGTGLGARATIKGALAIPHMMLDGGIAIGNAINRATNAIGLTDAAEFPSASSLTDQLLTHLGLAEPETAGERIASDVQAGLTGGGAFATGAKTAAARSPSVVERRVLETLSHHPGVQTVAGGTSAAAAGATREAGGGPLEQLMAGIAGGVAPSAIRTVAPATVRGVVRGGERGRQRYNERLADFEEAGVDPTVAQASGNRRMAAVDTTLAKAPGGAGPMAATAQREAEQMRVRINEIADSYMPSANATKAGHAIEKGLQNFVTRFREEQRFLYDKVDAYIPPGSRVPVSNVAAKLDELVAPIQGATNLSAGMTNPTIVKLRGLLQADAQGGSLPYQAIKELRTTIGEKISNPTLTDDIGTARWKQIYGALSDDMEAAAAAAGPDAQRAFSRANAYTRAGHNRIETTLNRVSGQDSAEKVFQAAVNPSEVREGATTLNAVMRSLSPNERRAVSGAVVRRMGQANPGQQDAAGEVFSAQTFLTNWNKFSPEAKQALFADRDARRGLDAIALAAQRMREGASPFNNPSGTAAGAAQVATYAGLGTAAVTLNFPVAAAIASGIAATNGAARLMANPKFVRWIGKATETPAEMLPTQLQFLTQQANKWSSEDREALGEFIESVSVQ